MRTERPTSEDANHRAPETYLPRVFPHEIGIRDPVGAADLEQPALLKVDIQGGKQVGEHVLDSDRLRARDDPARHQKEGRTVNQRAHDLEGDASRADHYRRPKLNRRDARLTQDPPDLVTALAVSREIVVCAEAPQVDDPADPALACGGREVFRAPPVGA